MIEYALFGLILLIISWRLYRSSGKVDDLQEKNKLLASQKKSLETIYGYAVENLVPHLDGMKGLDPKLFKHMGQPIDFVYFGEDEIKFIEVKSGDARLSAKQKRIKKLIEDGNVVFEEFRVQR